MNQKLTLSPQLPFSTDVMDRGVCGCGLWGHPFTVPHALGVLDGPARIPQHNRQKITAGELFVTMFAASSTELLCPGIAVCDRTNDHAARFEKYLPPASAG